MRTFTAAGCGLALAGALMLCSGAARAQHGDADRQEAVKTVQKEIGAAYDEAKRVCAQGAAAERTACLQAARHTWENDMKNAPAQVDAARDMGGVTTTTTKTVGTASTTTSTTETPVTR